MSTANAMQLTVPHVGFLPALEVRDLLISLRGDQAARLDTERAAHATRKQADPTLPAFNEASERQRILSDDQRIVLAKILQCIEDPLLRRGTTASVDKMHAYMREVDDFTGPTTFTKVEQVRLADNVPSSYEELHAVVELVGERLCEARGVEQDEDNWRPTVQGLIDITDRHFAPRVPMANGVHGPDDGDEEGDEEADDEMAEADDVENGLDKSEVEEIEDAMAEDQAETDLVEETGRTAARDPNLDIDEEG